MSKLRFSASLDVKAWRACGITATDDLILLRYPHGSKMLIRTELQKIANKNNENDKQGLDSVELDVTIDIHYRPRSLQANKMMWALYTVLADIITAEEKTYKTTPEELYAIDMQDWAPKHIIYCTDESRYFTVQLLQEENGKVKNTTWNKNTGMWEIEVWQTSSYWNVKQQCEHIERLLFQLETMGRNRINNGDIAKIYSDFKKWEKKENGKG